MTVAVQGGVITFDEGVGGETPVSPSSIRADRDRRGVSRIGLIDWTDIDALISECFPAAPALPGAYPGVSYLYCQSLDLKPFPSNPEDGDINCTGDVAIYSKALATITYAPLEYDASDLITRVTSYSTEDYLIPGPGAVWEDNNDKIQTGAFEGRKRIQIIHHQLTYHRVPNSSVATLDAAIRANVGKINDGVYEGAADETLLFAGAQKNWTVAATGVQTWSYSYEFMERRIEVDAGDSVDPVYGWLHQYREDGEWVRLKTPKGNFFYEKSANFADLFS